MIDADFYEAALEILKVPAASIVIYTANRPPY